MIMVRLLLDRGAQIDAKTKVQYPLGTLNSKILITYIYIYIHAHYNID